MVSCYEGTHSVQNGETLIPNLPETSYRQTETDDGFTIYKRRWYIVMLYCMISIMQCMIGNFWAPIQATACAVYHWQSYMIDLLVAWQPICYCLAMPLFAWLMDVKGLRTTMIIASCLQTAGAIIYCFTIDDHHTLNTSLINCGVILNSLAGPISLAMPPLLSSTWFPVHQRTTATALVLIAAFSGDAVAFVLSPAFVDDISLARNITKVNGNYVLNDKQRSVYEYQIKHLLYGEAAVMTVLFIAVLIYFPAKPLTEPSRSARKARLPFIAGLKRVLTNHSFLLLAGAYGTATAVIGAWFMVLDQCLSQFNLPVSQNLAGWLGFICAICGSISSVVCSLLVDRFFGYMKTFLIFSMASTFFILLLISYVFLKIISYNVMTVYILFGLLGFCLNSSIPLFFELGVEISFPVGEGLTTGLMTLSNNFLQSIFLVVPLANLGTKWMLWTNVSVCVFALFLLLLVKDKYRRRLGDKTNNFE